MYSIYIRINSSHKFEVGLQTRGMLGIFARGLRVVIGSIAHAAL